jgi:hypothetical protein
VLMHHAYAERTRLPGRPDTAGLAGDTHLPGIAPDQPVCDVHQGGLPGAVLPEKSMHLPGLQHEIGPAECLHGAESLVDSDEIEDRGQLRQSPVG